jgi:ectoine hydroxylase
MRLSSWNHPGNTIYGMLARSESIVNSGEKLLGGEVYHYQNDVLFPLLTSAYIAVDRATRQNGCEQVIKGSHDLGRIDRVTAGNSKGDEIRGLLVLERWRVHYNTVRPHSSLGYCPPAPEAWQTEIV